MNTAHKKKFINLKSLQDHHDLRTYTRAGGFKALAHTLAQSADNTINEIISFGLLDRGEESYWMGQKLSLVRKHSASKKYIVCSIDENKREEFKTRFIMTSIPYQLIEGMTIAAYAAKATQGYIYIRQEDRESQKTMKKAIIKSREYGLLGEEILGNDFSFDIEVISEERDFLYGNNTAASRSEENGCRPDKMESGSDKYMSESQTVIHNAETLTNIPKIITHKRSWKRALGQMAARKQKEEHTLLSSRGTDCSLIPAQHSFEILSGTMAEK
jgi:NADH:ubiquinone oxidoreductase subunit F (NADH-binding)